MKAKELITGRGLSEAEGTPPPPGSAGEQERPMPGRPSRPMRGPGGPPHLRRMMGGPGEEEPQGFFNRQEQNQLQQILILTLATIARSDLDIGIAHKLMAGQELEPGELQHILDEASRLKLPESHTPILQKIYQKLDQG